MNVGVFSQGRGASITNGGNSSPLLPIAVQYAADGVDFADLGVGGVQIGLQGIEMPREYLQGVVKVLGVGIEVINTTSELYKQGLVSYCRQSQPDAESSTVYIGVSTPANQWYQTSTVSMRTLPKNLKEMALYPGFAQTEAKEGYYGPVLLHLDSANRRNYPQVSTTLLFDDDPKFGSQVGVPDILCYTTLIVTGKQIGRAHV